MRRPTRRPSLRDQQRKVKASLDFMADMAGKPRLQIDIAPKRAYTRNTSEDELEKGVQRAVTDLLAVHPSVLLAVRQNSGAMHAEDERGHMFPIWFFKLVKKPEDLRITDFWGFMRDGRPFAIECKRRNWTGPHNLREHQQQAFLTCIRSIGGIGAFVRSSEEAQTALAG